MSNLKDAIGRRRSRGADSIDLAGLVVLVVLVLAGTSMMLVWLVPRFGLLFAIIAWVAVLGLAIGLPVLAVQYIGESLD
ncbi:hypothetical protein [Haloarchaeobius sp. HME9146]|uniref:hypothetical protein n=1 Tax=Haloarchaeobius sp. HME9146 TaxID=2978732 RepID=UPI0021C1709E|nr:hypothetical protein [Haloarchaeobius sp. HME9146]MCT9094494.1 hypothetical protein [Haloarchaeobius sp. HME9146]